MSMNGFLTGASKGLQSGVQMYESMPGMTGTNDDGTPGTEDNPGKGASKAANDRAYQRAMQQHWMAQDAKGATNQGYNALDPSSYSAAGVGWGNSLTPVTTSALPAPPAQTFARGGMVKCYDAGGAVQDDPDQVSAPQPAATQVQSEDLPAPTPAAAIASPQNGAPIDPNTGDPATLQQQALAEPDQGAQAAPQGQPQPAQPQAPTQYQTVLQAAAGEGLKYNQD